MAQATPRPVERGRHPGFTVALAIGALLVAAILVWQAVATGGVPNPTSAHTSATVAILDTAILVFREGLECVLVLSAITAGLMGSQQPYRRPIGIGAGVGFVATVVTWFIAIGVMNGLSANISALSLQAWTGLLAIVVLLIVMNWFFHNVYWTGWISLHNRKKRALLKDAALPGSSRTRVLWGLGLLGVASVYREGFEVVLFLQSYRLQMGDGIVLMGAIIGLILTGIVAILTFAGHHHLPYKRMLVATGVLLAAVLFVMIGEEIFEMQQAHWIGTTPIPMLNWIPDWAGTWFSIFPNWQAVIAQVGGVGLVLGCYGLARYQAVILPKKKGGAAFEFRDTAPLDGTSAHAR